MLNPSGAHSANFVAASTVLPPYAEMSACGTVPTPRPPHHDACASVELFSWMSRNPEHPLAKTIARPGFELQRRFSTKEPSPEQIEVADAARDACLALEK